MNDTAEKILEYETKISILKINLRKTDYLAIKYAEGEITAVEYAETKAQRREWRTEINAYEVMIARLKGE